MLTRLGEPLTSSNKNAVRIRTVTNGRCPSQWALEVTRVNKGELDVLQMSSNWGVAQLECKLYIQDSEQTETNERKLLECLRNDSMECLHNVISGDTMSVSRKLKRVIIL